MPLRRRGKKFPGGFFWMIRAKLWVSFPFDCKTRISTTNFNIKKPACPATKWIGIPICQEGTKGVLKIHDLLEISEE